MRAFNKGHSGSPGEILIGKSLPGMFFGFLDALLFSWERFCGSRYAPPWLQLGTRFNPVR